MNNLELNINNYTFEDVLGIFKLDKAFTELQLNKCKETVNKMHPTNSKLDIQYYNLYSNAYDVLNESLQKRIELLKTNTIKPPDVVSAYIPPCLFSTRIVTIHTEDRDVLKYPYENIFEIELPSTIKNTQSIELFDISLPTFYYNISDYLQNTKFWFSVNTFFTEPVEITISSGYYNGDELATQITDTLNKTMTSILYSIGAYTNTNTQYTKFSITYNTIENVFIFTNTTDGFTLNFDISSKYNNCTFNCWKMLSNWGLAYNIGFYKNTYTSIYNTNLLQNMIKSPKIIDLTIYNSIYMEIDTFNWIDEIKPFNIATNDYFNNDYNGIVNSSFAKLSLSNVLKCYIPVDKFKRILPHMVEKTAKLKFKFRYHNGIPVDFMGQDFNFSIKFECKLTGLSR